MKRVTGIGGIFFKSKDPKALGAWYKAHLGIDVQEWGGAAFDWKNPDNPEGVGTTAWSLRYSPSSISSVRRAQYSWSSAASGEMRPSSTASAQSEPNGPANT